MKLTEMTINDWQEFIDSYKREHVSDGKPLAMRVEITQLTVARYAGGARIDGQPFTYFEPIIPGHAPNPDGTPYVAWLLVRDSILLDARKWAKAKGKAVANG